jgi:protein-disulfide isomerase
MMENRIGGFGRSALVLAGLAMALLGGLVGWFWQAQRAPDRVGIEKVVRDYILANPEILPQAMENLRKRETIKQLAGVRADVTAPFAGAVLGNPAGKVTLVEFSDFACGYCRQSEADVAALIKVNPDLKVVIRQLPILSAASADAARMGLAAAKQGRYAAFHHAMYAAGRPDAASIETAARSAGLDLARARQDATDPQIEAEIERNLDLARKLGFDGTPSWVVGDEIHAGAVGKEVLAEAIVKARG